MEGWIDHGSMELKESYQEKALLNPCSSAGQWQMICWEANWLLQKKQIKKRGSHVHL